MMPQGIPWALAACALFSIVGARTVQADGEANPPAYSRIAPSADETAPMALDAPFSIEAVQTEGSDWQHFYRVSRVEAGVYQLVVERKIERPGEEASRIVVRLRMPGRRNEEYRAESARPLWFYPVLDGGDVLLDVLGTGGKGDVYRLSLRPDPCEVTEVLKSDARAAVEKGVAYLLSSRPASPEEETRYWAVEGLALAAVCGGRDGGKRMAQLEKDYVEPMEAAREESPGRWNGKPVSYLGYSVLYDQSIVALGLSEAVACGSARAKALLPTVQRYILASQLSPRRCEAWGCVAKEDRSFGGWRYDGNSVDADLSVTGWCIVALLACNAVGVSDPALPAALEDGVTFVTNCCGEEGFAYMPHQETGDVRTSVGVLALMLAGENCDPLKDGLERLDRTLPAGTQVLEGAEYPLYYAYYGTRADYLRGGKVWQRWRSVMMRQLLRSQLKDGSWEAYGDEIGLPPRCKTAFAVMILRICLEDVPAYLRQEARGF